MVPMGEFTFLSASVARGGLRLRLPGLYIKNRDALEDESRLPYSDDPHGWYHILNLVFDRTVCRPFFREKIENGS